MGEVLIEKYTRQDTYFAKGIAILGMLFHHAYPNICYRPFFLLEDQSFVALFAATLKFSISLMTILSGFGLAQVYRSKNIKTVKGNITFVISRFIQLFSIYWPVNVMIGFFTFIKDVFIEPRADAGGLELFLEITGIKPLTGDWFLIAIMILYALFPLLYKFVDRFGVKALAVTFIPWLLYFVRLFFGYLLLSFDTALFYIFAFSLGIYLSTGEKLVRKISVKKSDILKAVLLLILSILLRLVITLPVDAFVALAILHIQSLTGSGTGILSKILKLYGKQSPNIWLLQYSIFILVDRFFTGHWLIRLLLICGACLAASLILNIIKKVTGFDPAIKKFRVFVENK